jgi:hypothetical protein
MDLVDSTLEQTAALSFPVLSGTQQKGGIQSLDMALMISAICSKSALLSSKYWWRGMKEGRHTYVRKQTQ